MRCRNAHCTVLHTNIYMHIQSNKMQIQTPRLQMQVKTYRYKYNNVFSPKTSDFNIENNTLETILNNQKVKEFFESTKDFNSAHECCKIQCGVKNG